MSARFGRRDYAFADPAGLRSGFRHRKIIRLGCDSDRVNREDVMMMRMFYAGLLSSVVFVSQAAPPAAGLATAPSSAATSADACPLRGVWKSNEAKTLASLRATGKVNDRERALYENHFFGHLTMSYTCTAISVRYAGDSETLDYEVLQQQGPRITIRTIADDSDEGKVRELTLEPDARCYSEPVAGLGFREYFCRE